MASGAANKDELLRKDLFANIKRLQDDFERNKNRVKELGNSDVNRKLVVDLNKLIAEVKDLASKYGIGSKEIDKLRQKLKQPDKYENVPNLTKQREELMKQLNLLQRNHEEKRKGLLDAVNKLGVLTEILGKETSQQTTNLKEYEALLDRKLDELAKEYALVTGSVSDMNQAVETATKRMQEWLAKSFN